MLIYVLYSQDNWIYISLWDRSVTDNHIMVQVLYRVTVLSIIRRNNFIFRISEFVACISCPVALLISRSSYLEARSSWLAGGGWLMAKKIKSSVWSPSILDFFAQPAFSIQLLLSISLDAPFKDAISMPISWYSILYFFWVLYTSCFSSKQANVKVTRQLA